MKQLFPFIITHYSYGNYTLLKFQELEILQIYRCSLSEPKWSAIDKEIYCKVDVLCIFISFAGEISQVSEFHIFTMIRYESMLERSYYTI